MQLKSIGLAAIAAYIMAFAASAQSDNGNIGPTKQSDATTLLKPAQVFDGEEMHPNWIVLVRGSTILYAGVADEMPDGDIDQTLVLDGQTLLPGLIEGHSHILLHPYNDAIFHDQLHVA